MSDSQLNNPDKTWLVKSSTRVLGPFSLREVTELLKTRQISVIDEIRQSSGRWSYIRENKLFLDIVRSVRDEIDSTSEATMTQSVTHQTFTKTAEVFESDELTPTPFPSGEYPSPPMRDIKDVTHSEGTPSFRSSGPAKSYGASGDRRVRAEIVKRSRVWSWLLSGFAALSAVAVFVLFAQKQKNRGLGFDDLISQALRYKSLGMYGKSLQFYNKAVALQQPPLNAQIEMAPVLISEDRQTMTGRRILEKALLNQEGMSRQQIMDAYLGIAVSYMMDGDLKQAEDILQKAIGREPANASALKDMAIIQLKKGQYGEAFNKFQDIYQRGNSSNLVLVGMSLAAIEYTKSTSDMQILPQLEQSILEGMERSGALRQELALLLSYMQYQLGKEAKFRESLGLFLKSTPGESAKYVRPLSVDWRFSHWDYLEKYCGDLYQSRPSTAQLKAMRALCLMEVNRDSDAQRLLQEALTEAPGDQMVLVTQAGYLFNMKRYPEAMVILKGPLIKDMPLRTRLQGKVCLATQDWACARDAFSSLYAQDRRDVEAIYGLAMVTKAQNDRAKAFGYVQTGLQVEPNYLPLIELRDLMESE